MEVRVIPRNLWVCEPAGSSVWQIPCRRARDEQKRVEERSGKNEVKGRESALSKTYDRSSGDRGSQWLGGKDPSSARNQANQETRGEWGALRIPLLQNAHMHACMHTLGSKWKRHLPLMKLLHLKCPCPSLSCLDMPGHDLPT